MQAGVENGTADVVVIGAGIVGLATAYQFTRRHPGAAVVVVDKEPEIATHQSSHNSGVIHSGIYYAPGSHKAQMVAAGRRMLLEFADSHDLRYSMSGKLVVAASPQDVIRLDALAERAAANGVLVEPLETGALQEREPNVRGLAALHVPSAGIIDFGEVSRMLAKVLSEQGVEVRTSWPVAAIDERGGAVTVAGPAGVVRGRWVVSCAGLHSDRIAKLSGADLGGVRIMPFRGEYFDVVPGRTDIVRMPVYPLPDPAFPFLGVHLTTTIGGGVHAGPNAVPALRREGYRWRDASMKDMAEIAAAGGSWRLARRYWRTGTAEIYRSLSRRAFVRALQTLTPDITANDLVRAPSGVRAQAIGPGGILLDDFAIATSGRGVHVVNAPSPAATASFAIGDHIVNTLVELRVGRATG